MRTKSLRHLPPRALEHTLATQYQITVRLDVDSENRTLEIRKIYIPPNRRGTGVGSKVMQDIVDWADANQYNCILTASDLYGSDVRSLVRFYSRFGFTEKKSHRYGVDMARE